ncbi:hypothetical protein MPLA_760001 [Mesorhizobium sp. ORS 3359]|uniref:hypothetical protein n=1 Tax=Mesorhizobium sp. LCM 4576 TaxID=1848289 RepID=UPI000502C2AB|nr:hypothetical protein [Mesorhizobium sp. LCM 4576]OHV69748.1 hypothetical protein LCM4576_22215 [Mesorhizobium sp. LCM 4576]CDX45241.1 hypothetical protein MPLA_760001 [Mesorhizobium sp. ORS 3359]
MTAATPLARYSAVEGALASGFATAQLHHLWGRDLDVYRRLSAGMGIGELKSIGLVTRTLVEIC